MAPLDTDQDPPAIGWVYCAVLFAQIVEEPEIGKLEVTPTTKLEVDPDLAKLVIVPFEALFTILTTVVTDALSPAAIP